MGSPGFIIHAVNINMRMFVSLSTHACEHGESVYIESDGLPREEQFHFFRFFFRMPRGGSKVRGMHACNTEFTRHPKIDA